MARRFEPDPPVSARNVSGCSRGRRAHFIAADAEVLADAGGSDHAPITARLTWAR